MQTDAAGAPNSQQKLQHWIKKNQINKKTNQTSNTFFRRIPVKKGKEKHNTGTKEVKSTIQGSVKEKGKGKGKKVRWTRDLKRACSAGFWEGKCWRNMGSTGTKESTEKGNAGGKGSAWEKRVKSCEEVRWERHLERACSTGF